MKPTASSPEALARMKRQKRADTRPELVVRRIVHRTGARFRVGNKELPGSPDLANRRRRWAIFVHGCYWHHHEGCSRATIPRANREFWVAKFAANRARDARKREELIDLGFRVMTVWECETRQDLERLADRLGAFVGSVPMGASAPEGGSDLGGE